MTGFLLVRLFENPKRMFEDEENWETPDESLAPVPHNTKPSAQVNIKTQLKQRERERVREREIKCERETK